jgi:DNA-binding XRE family transcriptional regulator
MMDNAQKAKLIDNMVTNLPALRRVLGVSQEGLAEMVGLNRSTIAAIENRKRKLSWDTFLALLLVFIKNPTTDKLLSAMEIYTDEFNVFIKGKAKDDERDN